MWCLLPGLPRWMLLGPVFFPRPDRSHDRGVHAHAREVELVRFAQALEQQPMELLPHAGLLPRDQTTPSRDPRRMPCPWRHRLPGNAGAQHVDDHVEALAVVVAWPASRT